MPFINRKYTRLKNKELYSTPGTIAHIIIGTQNKIPYFKNQVAAENITRLVMQTAEERNIKLYAYCVMPDHIHLLFAASNNCSITDYVRIIKGRFSASCRNAGWEIRFQRSFYDHLLRKEDDIEEVSRYIIGNPVRARIKSVYGVYPYAGSMVYKI